MHALHHSLLGLLLGLAVSSAFAQDNAQSFNIPAQPLATAIDRLANQTGLHVFYADNVVQGRESATVTGTYTPQQALSQLLAGSGIQPMFTADDTVALKVAPAFIKTAAEEGATLPKVTVEADSGDSYDDPNWATDPYNTDYTRPNSVTATKTDTPIMETPVSIQVVPQEVLRDQQAYRLEDALKNVSGVQREHGGGAFLDSFVIRGFENRFARFRNGLRLGSTGLFGVTQEIANVEQIEVLKGPASVLYGRIEPGGIINIATKKPLTTPYYSLEQQFGSYDLYRTTIDATGPVTKDGKLLYRMNFAYLDKGSFRDFLSDERFFVAPSFSWRPSDDTEVNLTYEYRNETDQFDSGIPAIGNRPAPVPISRRFDKQPGLDSGNEVHLVDFNVSHRFNQDWTVRGGFLGSFANYDQELIIPINIRDDNRTIERAIFSDKLNGSSISQEDISAYLDLSGHFQLFGTQHTVLVGADHYEGRSDAAELTFGFSTIDTIDVFNPNQGSIDHDDLLRTNPLDGFFANRQSWYGIYFQDQIKLWDKLHILGGGRYDWAENENGSSSTSFGDITFGKNNTERFSPRVGLLYQPWSWLSLYGNYVESLGASNGRSATGQALSPETAEQLEAGVKAEFFDKRLTSTLAFFEITKQNVLTPDLSTADPFDSIAIGEARSQGIELDVAGQVTDRVKLIGTYALTEAKLTKDNGGNQGHLMPNVPTHAGSLWVKFDAIPDRFETGVGAYVAGERQGDVANSFQMPGYVRVDAFAAYHWELGDSRLTARVNINNMFDKTYYFGGEPSFAFPRVNILPADPLTVLGSLRLEF